MLSPDNYVQSPDFTQSLNRYAYCWNNPLKFTDPDGEWVHIVIGAAIGGTFNWIANGAEFSWDGLGHFAIGAGIGAISAATGGAVSGALASSTAFGAMVAGGATAGAVSGGLNSAIYGGNVGKGIWQGALGGAIGGMVPGMNVNGIIPGALVGAATGALGGGLAGGTLNAINGGNFTEGFKQGAINGALGGAISGGVYGGIAAANSEYDRNIIFGNLTHSAREAAFRAFILKYELYDAGMMNYSFDALENAYGVTRPISPLTGEEIGVYTASRDFPNGVNSNCIFNSNKIMSLRKIEANVVHEKQHVVDFKSGEMNRIYQITGPSDKFRYRNEIRAHQNAMFWGFQKSYNNGRITHYNTQLIKTP
jgi:hypothetical protein